MENIIPEKFVRMCRLLEITTFPVHWKFEEKDQQIVVTFIWNIGSSEILTPHQATKTDSTVAIDSKKNCELVKHDCPFANQTILHHSTLKLETPTKDVSSKSERRSKSKSSSRTTLRATSSEDRKSPITENQKEKRADKEDRPTDTECEKTCIVSSSKDKNCRDSANAKDKNCRDSANAFVEKTIELKKLDCPKPSSKHRHSSSDSAKKHKISCSKDATSEKGQSDPKRRHSSTKSKSASSLSKSSDKTANPEIGSNMERHSSGKPTVQKLPNTSAPSQMKNIESRHKESIIRKKDKSKDSKTLSDKNHKETRVRDEKKYRESSSLDVKRPSVRDQKKPSLRHVADTHNTQLRREKTNKDLRCAKTEKDSKSQCETQESAKAPKTHSESHSDKLHEDVCSRCEHTSKKSRSQNEETQTEKSSQCRQSIKECISRCKKESSPECEQTSNISSLPCEQTSNKSSLPCEQTSNKSSLPCEQTSNKSSLPCEQTSNKSSMPCEQTSNKLSLPCEQTLNKSSLPCEQTSNKSRLPCEQTSNKSSLPSEQTSNKSSSRCDPKDKLIDCEKALDESSSRCDQTPKISSVRNEDTAKQLPYHQGSFASKTQNKVRLEDSKPLHEKTSKRNMCEISKNSKSLNTKTRNIDKNKQPKKSLVNPKALKSEDTSDQLPEEHKSLEGERGAQDKESDVPSTELSRGKRREDGIQDEQPKKIKMDVNIKPLDQSKEVYPLLGKSKDVPFPEKLSDHFGQAHNEESQEESSTVISPVIAQKPVSGDYMAPATPQGSTTFFPKNDLWEMFVNRCKVKTDVTFCDPSIKESVIHQASVEPEVKIGASKNMQPTAKEDKDSKTTLSTDRNKKPAGIPPKDRKQNTSKPHNKSATCSRLNKKGLITPKAKNTTNTKTTLFSRQSTQKLPVQKKLSKELPAKIRPLKSSDVSELIELPLPEEKSSVQNTLSKECCKNMESALESKNSCEDTNAPINAVVTDSSEKSVELSKEFEHGYPVDSNEDDSFTELEIDLEYVEPKNNIKVEESLRKENQDSISNKALKVVDILASNQEMDKIPPLPDSQLKPQDERTDIDGVSRLSKEDPTITINEGISQDTNTPNVQNQTIKRLSQVLASSEQNIVSENGSLQVKLLEEEIHIDPDEEEVYKNKLERKDISSKHKEEGENVSGKHMQEIGEHIQEKEQNSNLKIEKEDIRSNVCEEVVCSEPNEEKLCNKVCQDWDVYNVDGREISSKDQEKGGIVETDLEEGEIEDEDVSRVTFAADDMNVVTNASVFESVLLACSPVSSTDHQIEPLGVLDDNDLFHDVTRNQSTLSTNCQMGNGPVSTTTTPTAVNSFQNENFDRTDRASTPLLDEMNELDVQEEPGMRSIILPKSQNDQKQCLQSKTHMTSPDRKKTRKRKKRSTNQSSTPDVLDIFKGEKLSRRKRKRLVKQLRKQLSELPDPSPNIEAKKEQYRPQRANRCEPMTKVAQGHSTQKQRHDSDWDTLLQTHIHEMKRPKPIDAKKEDLNKKIDNFLVEINLENNKTCPSTFLSPSQTYKQTTEVIQRTGKVPKQVNFGNLIDVQSYTRANGETSLKEREQFEHDSLMDSIIISSTHREENKEKTSKKRKRRSDDSDLEPDPKTRKCERTYSRSLPRMNRDIAIQQRINPDSGLHQYLFLFEDSRPCKWIDSDEIMEYNPHFYNSLKKCFVPKEGSQKQTELQQKLYDLVGYPS